MSITAQNLARHNLILPAPMQMPAGVTLPFPMVNIRGNRVIISGHGPLNADGSLAGPFGKLGADVSVEQGFELAQLTALAILSSLQEALGDLDRITGWVRVFGMVNATPDFQRSPDVINGFSDIVHKVFPADIATHARSAVGMATLPFQIAVEIEAEVLISGGV